MYSVTVIKSLGAKEIDSWVVYRRYSDFYDFHIRLEERVSNEKIYARPLKLFSFYLDFLVYFSTKP